jgi:hypothetical protein
MRGGARPIPHVLRAPEGNYHEKSMTDTKAVFRFIGNRSRSFPSFAISGGSRRISGHARRAPSRNEPQRPEIRRHAIPA